MTNVDKLVMAVSEWLTRVGASVLPKVHIPTNSWIANLMRGAFGIDLSTYNVWNELGFLLKPTIEKTVAPMIYDYVSLVPEEKVEEMAMAYAEAFIAKAQETGSVNIFGIELGVNAFEGLRDIIHEKFRA